MQCKELGAQFARASCRVSDGFSALMQSASCVYYFARVLQNCGVPCREPGAQFAKAAALFLTASAHGCSTVAKTSAYRCPAVVSYELQSAKVAASTTLLEFYQNAEGLSLPGQALPGKPRCTVKPCTTSAWVEVMLNPPGVDCGYITLFFFFFPRTFPSARGVPASGQWERWWLS